LPDRDVCPPTVCDTEQLDPETVNFATDGGDAIELECLTVAADKITVVND